MNKKYLIEFFFDKQNGFEIADKCNEKIKSFNQEQNITDDNDNVKNIILTADKLKKDVICSVMEECVSKPEFSFQKIIFDKHKDEILDYMMKFFVMEYECEIEGVDHYGASC